MTSFRKMILLSIAAMFITALVACENKDSMSEHTGDQMMENSDGKNLGATKEGSPETTETTQQ